MDLFLGQKNLAAVLLPRPFDQAFTYAFDQIPELGAWVEVPFGGTSLIGVVWALGGDQSLDPKKLKGAKQILPAVAMSADQRALIDLIAGETMMTRGEALRLALPPRDALAPKATQTLAFAVQAPSGLRFSPGQQRLLETLGQRTLPKAELLTQAGVSAAVYAGLKNKGAIAEEKAVPALQSPSWDWSADIALNVEQKAAAEAIAAGEGVFLLDGITGSGKTHVYFAAIKATLARGQQVLWLVPEIALTDQLRARFAAQFGAEPLLWHSLAGAGAKARAWRLAASGQPCVVLGARSALHCNFQNLGLVIVDEEHEQALKQVDMGAYHARDMAEARAKLAGAKFVMGSATPSLESEARARQGLIPRLKLTQRFAAALPPRVELVDLRDDMPARGAWLSHKLIHGVENALASGDQALLFLNRRGYAPLSLCGDCGHRLHCHQCSAWLVEHRFTNQLHCHLCGEWSPKPTLCPSCESEDSLVPCGPGIERLMEEAVAMFPQARIGVFSSDTLRTPAETRAAFAAVQSGQFNLLIGTQVLAKGLDFPDLTLVGVVDGDLGLSNEDLRASERTFQLLQQVTGRAGRGLKAGHALIQTRASDSALMQALAAHDREAFYDMELKRREMFNMPPFSRLAALMIAHENPEILEETVAHLARIAPQAEGVDLWGPSPARLPLVRGWHRKRFVFRVPKGKRPQSYLATWLEGMKFSSKTRVNIDIDPLSFS